MDNVQKCDSYTKFRLKTNALLREHRWCAPAVVSLKLKSELLQNAGDSLTREKNHFLIFKAFPRSGHLSVHTLQ
jgi:hypothetical protein